MSADEHLERLRYDIDTVLQLQLRSWSDEAWEPVADALAEYGFGVIKGWMHTGQIFNEVAGTGYGAIPRCPPHWFDDDTVTSLVGLTVSEALHYFKFEVLMKNRWDASKGASLATYFVGQCKFKFANVYKGWRKKEEEHRQVLHWDAPPIPLPTNEQPSDPVMTEAAVRAILSRLSSPLAQQVFWKKFVQGYSYEEIAVESPTLKNAKAVQNLVFRERRRLKT